MARVGGTAKQIELHLPIWGGRRKRRRKRGRGENRKNFLHHFPDEAARYEDVPRDPFSSAWRERGRDPPVVPARTWLLAVGWRIRAGEVLLSLASTS